MSDSSIPPDPETAEHLAECDPPYHRLDCDGECMKTTPPTLADEGLELLHYVLDLEALVKWFALLYRRETYVNTVPGAGDNGSNVKKVVEYGEPIWAVQDQYGHDLPDSQRLQRTWNRVIHET